MHKNLIFDCGNVLHVWSPDYLATSFTDNEEDKELFMNVLFPKWAMMDKGMSCEEFIGLMEKEFEPRLHAQIRKLVYDWVYYFKPIPEMYDIIKGLKEKHNLYVLSNMPKRFLEVMYEDPVFYLFDGMVFSCDVEMVKPNKEIYEYILNKYNMKAEDCIFFDDMQPNLDGATAVGIDTYKFDYTKLDEFKEWLKNNE